MAFSIGPLDHNDLYLSTIDYDRQLGYREVVAKVVELSADAREAWELMLQLFFGQRDRFMALSVKHGLTPVHTKALLDLDPDQPAPMRRLAAQLSCDASYVTNIVDRLEERGYVERRLSNEDRRVKEVVLTAAGRDARNEIHEALHKPPESLAQLSAADQRTLRNIVRRITSA
jgi:DNA-binding MarR family transcriptional regulator